jgi:hypothetical protein
MRENVMKNQKYQQRRDFIKYAGLGALSLSAGFRSVSLPETVKNSYRTSEESNINGFEFEYLFQGDNFLGIGKVSVNGILLRSGRLPLFAHISTPDAVELTNFRLKSKSIQQDAIVIDFTAQKMSGDNMEWMLHTVRNRRNLHDWTKQTEDAPDTLFTMVIRPVQRKIGKVLAKGFSYQYGYMSDSLPIYKITDRASWEIGGTAIGNELWMRNGVADPIVEFKNPRDFYSTEWYLPGIANPNIFQFHPFQTHLQGFSFTSSKDGNLITFPSKVSHIRSLFEKWRGANEIVHFHEHCNDLSGTFETSPVEVFWIPGELDRVGRANLYDDVREMVHEELHAQVGMKRERITTYGVIEEQAEPDFEKYTITGLPKLLSAGVKTVFIPSQCQNDMNTWGLSNMCCNVDYKIAAVVGEEKLKKFCKTAQAGGARVEMWGNTAISTTTERFMHQEGKPKGIKFLPFKGSIMEVIRKSKSPFIRNASNAIEADHYAPRFCALNLRDEDIRTYWMKQWKYFHDIIGIEGIFLDSSFNMSSDKFHHVQLYKSKDWEGSSPLLKEPAGKYRPENDPPKQILTQYHAHLSWMAEMQNMGYHYCAEDLGVFGINRTGPDVTDRITSLHIWADSYCKFNEETIRTAGYEPMDIFFKGLAYRMMWMLFWDIKNQKLELGTENPAAYALIKIFNKVTRSMYNREILADENGVIYSRKEVQILWAFSNFEFPLPAKYLVENLVDSNKAETDKVMAKRNRVYRMTLKI